MRKFRFRSHVKKIPEFIRTIPFYGTKEHGCIWLEKEIVIDENTVALDGLTGTPALLWSNFIDPNGSGMAGALSGTYTPIKHLGCWPRE